jgi:hypothetical protein
VLHFDGDGMRLGNVCVLLNVQPYDMRQLALLLGVKIASAIAAAYEIASTPPSARRLIRCPMLMPTPTGRASNPFPSVF